MRGPGKWWERGIRSLRENREPCLKWFSGPRQPTMEGRKRRGGTRFQDPEGNRRLASSEFDLHSPGILWHPVGLSLCTPASGSPAVIGFSPACSCSLTPLGEASAAFRFLNQATWTSHHPCHLLSPTRRPSEGELHIHTHKHL